MRRHRNNLWAYIIVAILSLCIGITIGKLFDCGYFTISKELSVFEALNLFVTAALGFYIAWVLERKIQKDRVEKDIIISKIGEIENEINRILSMLDEEKIKYSQINSMIHRLGIVRNSLFEQIKSLNINPTTTDQQSIGDLTREEHNRLKRLLTETPIQQGGAVDITVKDNIATYTVGRKSEIMTSACLLKELFFVLKMAINKV